MDELIERFGHLNVVKLKKGTARMVSLVEDARSGSAVVLKAYDSGVEAVREYEVLDLCYGDPHVVRLLDFFEVQGKWCLITEYVPGYTLDAIVVKWGALEPAKVIDLAVDLLTGVGAVHANGYVHGDLHGNNVIVTDFEAAQTKIIDFQHAGRKLRSGKAMAIRRGERRRMAPEGAAGIIDERFDIYSVGYMCASLLTGVVNLDDPRAAGRPKIGADHPVWGVVLKATHRNPRKRYGSAEEMIRALRECGAVVDGLTDE